MMPSQNAGMDWRKSEARRLAWSTQPPRWVAESTPSGTATTVDSTMAAAASRAVAGQRCSRTMPSAGRRVCMDWPKSPRPIATRKSTYCAPRERSRPRRWRVCSISAWVAVGSTRKAAGSPVRRTRKKTKVTTPQTTTSACRRRRSRKDRIQSFPDGHAAEVHVQLGQRREAEHPRAVRVELDLLVERHHRRPVPDLPLEVGERAEALGGIDLAPGGLVKREQIRRERRPVHEGEGRPVAHLILGVHAVAGPAGGEAAVVRQRALVE